MSYLDKMVESHGEAILKIVVGDEVYSSWNSRYLSYTLDRSNRPGIRYFATRTSGRIMVFSTYL